MSANIRLDAQRRIGCDLFSGRSMQTRPAQAPPPNPFYCDVCRISTTDANGFAQHMAGKQHKKKANAMAQHHAPQPPQGSKQLTPIAPSPRLQRPPSFSANSAASSHPQPL
eukprot:1191015-Prorocentrum_minimum.AAC.1